MCKTTFISTNDLDMKGFSIRGLNLIWVLTLWFSIDVKAQWGAEIWIASSSDHYSETPNIGLTDAYLSPKVALNRWFRLKNYRLEFLPGVGFSFAQKNPSGNGLDLNSTHLYLQVPVLIYPLSFKDDCNCPTFSKQGNTIKKGLHFFINPTVQYGFHRYSSSEQKETLRQWSTGIGAGVGLDLALNKTWTLTPSLGVQQSFGEELWRYWSDDSVTKFRTSEIMVGIRMHYRHKAKQRY